MTEKELERYKRQIILPDFGEEGQLKLKKSKVLVVGAGGLGSPVLLYLTAAGIGNIGIMDFDEVSEHNLQRQILFNTNEIGQNKALIAKDKLSALNPYVNIKIYEKAITKENADLIIEKYDVVVSCVDNLPVRYIIDDVCKKHKKPHVFGAIAEFQGQLSVFNYKEGPSYRDLYPELPPEYIVSHTANGGVLGTLPGIIGTIQANEVIKIIVNIGNVLSGKLFVIDILTNEVNYLNI